MRCIPRLGMYTNKSRGILSIATVFVVRLIETTIMVSVLKLGWDGSTSWSVPMTRMFRMSLPLALTRGALVGMAVTCGFSVRCAGNRTTGNLSVGARLAAGALVTLVGATAVGVTGVTVGAMVGVVVNVAVGVSVGGTGVGVEVSATGVALGRFVFVGGSVAASETWVGASVAGGVTPGAAVLLTALSAVLPAVGAWAVSGAAVSPVVGVSVT